MSKSAVLITATYWEIFAEQFDTFEDARAQMMKELKEEIVRSGAMAELAEVMTNGEYEDCMEGWEVIKDFDKYNGGGFGEYGFSFRKDCARCETDGDNLLMWKVVEIQ